MEAHKAKSKGLNLNPLHGHYRNALFQFLKKLKNTLRMHAFPLPSSVFVFEKFSRQVSKRVQGRAPEHSKDIKIAPRVPKLSPRIDQLRPTVPPNDKNILFCSPKGGKLEPQVLQWSPRAPKVKEKHNTVPRSLREARKCATE